MLALLAELQAWRQGVEHKQVELRAVPRAVDDECADYRALFDQAPVGYCTIDPDGTITMANLELAKMLGVPRKQLAGCPIFRFLISNERQPSSSGEPQ